MVVAGAAAVLVLGGPALVVTSESVTFGWFACAPLSGDSFSPLSDALVLSRRRSLRAGPAGGGLLLLAVVLGCALGRRRPAPR